MDIAIEKIRLDGGTQMRVAIDEMTAQDYAAKLRDGIAFPPIDVFYDGSEYWLAHGFHRHEAHVLAGSLTVNVNIHQGARDDAQWFSFATNKDQDNIGLRRTNADKDRAVRAALSHPKANILSDQAIADYVGVSRAMVQSHRERILPQKQDATARQVTRNGTTYEMNVSSIGRRESSAHGETNDTPVAVVEPPADRMSEREAKRNSVAVSVKKIQDLRRLSKSISAMCNKPPLQVSMIELRRMSSELSNLISSISF